MIVEQRAVFLDRDGVINSLVNRDGGWFSPRVLQDFLIYPFVEESISRIRRMGYKVFIVTNQPDIARRLMTLKDLEAMHDSLRNFVQIDDILVCPHDNEDKCECRKPLPGLILEAAAQWSINLSRSWLIGDRDSDMKAANAAGVKAIHVLSGQETTVETPGVIVSRDLAEAVKIIETISL